LVLLDWDVSYMSVGAEKKVNPWLDSDPVGMTGFLPRPIGSLQRDI
jgi:hypothetical protein